MGITVHQLLSNSRNLYGIKKYQSIKKYTNVHLKKWNKSLSSNLDAELQKSWSKVEVFICLYPCELSWLSGSEAYHDVVDWRVTKIYESLVSPEISVDFTAVLINSGVSCWHVEMSPVQVVFTLDHYNTKALWNVLLWHENMSIRIPTQKKNLSKEVNFLNEWKVTTRQSVAPEEAPLSSSAPGPGGRPIFKFPGESDRQWCRIGDSVHSENEQRTEYGQDTSKILLERWTTIRF